MRIVLAASVLALLASSPDARAASPDPWFGRDKLLHFGVSAGLASGGYWTAALLTDEPFVKLGVGAGTALAAGTAKELWDLSGRGNASWRDLTWDVVGTLCGLAVSWGLDWLLSEAGDEPAKAPVDAPAQQPQAPTTCDACSPMGVPPLRAPTLF